MQNGKFRSREEIDSVYKLMDIVKDAHCIWAYEEDEASGYSEDGSYRSYRGSYDGGMSGARGRGRNARRDSMGRYSGEGYSRTGDMVDRLRELMADAPDDRTRQEIQRLVTKMESM